jgi:hypothetical protein
MRKFQEFLPKAVNEQEELAGVEFKDPKNIEVEMVEPKEKMVKSLGDTDQPGSLDEHFQKLLEFQMQVKTFHWGTEVHAEHIASDITYGTLNEVMDTLVEAYQGYVGRIKFGGQYQLLNYADVDAFSWLGGIEEIVKTLRDQIQYTDVQNILDELQAAISKFKYLLTLK